jgi:hypothetical protein
MHKSYVQLSKNKRCAIVGSGSVKSYRLEELSKECAYDDCETWHTIYDTFNVNVFLRDVKVSKAKAIEIKNA